MGLALGRKNANPEARSSPQLRAKAGRTQMQEGLPPERQPGYAYRRASAVRAYDLKAWM